MKTNRWLCAVLLALSLTCVAATTARAVAAATVTLSETGSTLLYPLFHIWAAQYTKDNPEVRLTMSGTGSGAGQAQAIDGTVRIGASDAYMSDEQLQAHPDIMNIPLAISAETVNYNLPGLNHGGLKLSGPVIAGMYAGTIRFWDDKQVAAINPGVALPHDAVIPVRRRDASGDTFMFTQFLSFSTDSWNDGPNYGTAIQWPAVAGAIDADGNLGMVDAVRTHPYAIAYIGTSFHDQIAKAGLGTALLQNQAGRFLLPTTKTVSDGASMLDPRTPPDERLSLVFAPGPNSYPIVAYEYAVVSKKQPSPATAAALRSFLLWAIAPCSGNSTHNLEAVHFVPLPDFIRALSIVQIEKIQ